MTVGTGIDFFLYSTQFNFSNITVSREDRKKYLLMGAIRLSFAF